MRHRTLLLTLGALLFVGCENNNQQPTARSEEPYTPGYASLDSMDSAPAADMTYQPPPPEPTADAPAATYQADEPLTPVGGRVHTVQKGDTLYKLARQFYSDEARWRDIWEANRNRISNPDRILVGTKLIIP